MYKKINLIIFKECFNLRKDYEECLKSLSQEEQEILKYWLDEEFYHTYSSKEIAQILGIASTKVTKIKDEAFQKVKNNPIMQKYNGTFLC